MLYGDLRRGRSRDPYAAFALQFSLGGGNTISQAGVRGRLFGRPFAEGSQYQFTIFQTFDYMVNHAYVFGGQGFEVEVAFTHPLSSGTSVSMAASGGATLLGVDSLLDDVTAVEGSSRLEEGSDPVWTTFILGIGQLRPWENRGFFVKAGMGIGFAGNGIYSPIGPPLAPPFTTNALALAYGTGWVFRREHRYAVQVHGLHHVVALGELTTVAGTSIKNVVGNYWTLGAALVVRQ